MRIDFETYRKVVEHSILVESFVPSVPGSITPRYIEPLTIH